MRGQCGPTARSPGHAHGARGPANRALRSYFTEYFSSSTSLRKERDGRSCGVVRSSPRMEGEDERGIFICMSLC